MKIKRKTVSPVVNLYYLTNVKYGGWMTYTVHLFKALQAVGARPRIIRVPKTTQPNEKDFGYGLQYRNFCKEDLKTLEGIHLITATGKNFHPLCEYLFTLGAWITIHDPSEIKNETFRQLVADSNRVVVIRTSNLEYLPKAHFIPHPFARYCTEAPSLPGDRKKNAIAISRIDFDKRTHWILEANRSLIGKHQVTVMGEEARQFTFRPLCPKFPEFKQNSDRPENERSRFPRLFGLAQEMCLEHRAMVDLSEIKGDGGGTQYTFLEAIDAGSVCVLNKAWIRPGEVMQPEKNCLAVGSSQELVALLRMLPKMRDTLAEIQENAFNILNNHNPALIGQKYMDAMSK